jgi:AGCS family alanine or glycine:cation symporter
MGNMAQANAISTSLGDTFSIPTWITALVTSILVGIITMGGVKRIGKITQYMLPVLSIAYMFGAIVVILFNINNLPQVFRNILTEAFGFNAITGGFTGSILRNSINVGLRRGIFSNEAGLGSSSMLHSATASDNPHTMGLWGMLEVFIDTIVCCTLTALAVLVTGVNTHSLDGTYLVIESFKYGLGEYSGGFIALAITLYAFATLIGWSLCGETCSKYLFGNVGIPVYKVAFVICVALGCILNGNAVWTLSDIFNGLMAVPNLVGMVMLSIPSTKKLLTDYQ